MSGSRPDPVAVLVVGSINVDQVVTVDSLPAPGETVTGGQFAISGGGKGANQAVAAARAGAEVALIGGVGRDAHGDLAISALADIGVDIGGVIRDGAPTGVALITVDAEGHNQIAVASGANASLDPEAVAAEVSRRATDRCVLVLSNELSDEVNLAAIESAPGARVILDPAPARDLDSRIQAASPILTPNEDEACEMTGIDDPKRAATRLHEITGSPAITTLGGDGAILAGSGGISAFPAPPVAAVDTTGAGDTLAGTLAARLALGDSIEDGLTSAIEAAAHSVMSAGAGWSLG
ncbi:MAG: ribokinase [Solirubrobacterales bacterium]